MKKYRGIEIEHDSDGWWGYCPDGLCNSSEPTSHTFHEDTKAELLQAIRDCLQPCQCCQECRIAAAKAGTKV